MLDQRGTMKEQKLKNYLWKADYIRPAIGGYKEGPLAPFRIIKQRKNRTKCILSHLQGVPYKTASRKQLALLLKSSHWSVLSLSANDLKSASNEVKTAKAVSEVEKKQDLHLLHYSMVYFAKKKRSTIKWQRPYRFNAAKKIKSLYQGRHPFKRASSLSKFSKITTKKEELLQEGKEILEQNHLAMEQEYSDRRNYRNSTSLHT